MIFLRSKEKERGVVLIVTLLFTLILTFLVLGVLQKSILESKMVSYFSVQDSSLAEAEQLLLQQENKVAKQEKTSQAIEISSSAIKNAPYVCGIAFYRIKVQAKNGTIIQSNYAIENKTDQCQLKPIVKIGRQAWFMGEISGI